ncbi:hypothetical protein D3C87_1694940 [compost metagenome]
MQGHTDKFRAKDLFFKRNLFDTFPGDVLKIHRDPEIARLTIKNTFVAYRNTIRKQVYSRFFLYRHINQFLIAGQHIIQFSQNLFNSFRILFVT